MVATVAGPLQLPAPQSGLFQTSALCTYTNALSTQHVRGSLTTTILRYINGLYRVCVLMCFRCLRFLLFHVCTAPLSPCKGRLTKFTL